MRWPSFIVVAALLGFTGCGLFGGGEEAPSKPPVAQTAADASGNGVAPGRTAVGGLQPHEMGQLDGVSDGAAVEAFYAKGFHYCDAVMLAGLWGVDSWEAKVKAGGMAQRSELEALDTSVESARSATRQGTITGCSWESLASWDDISALAGLWGQDTVEVKARVERKAGWGQFGLLAEEIIRARQGHDPHGVETEGEEHDAALSEETWMRAFFDSSKVDYCHAKMLSAAWGGSVSDSKSTLGYKVANGLWDSLAMAKDAARQHAQANASARCSFTETDFSPADARKLASMWSVDLDEAKAALASKYTYGLEDSVRAELRGG